MATQLQDAKLRITLEVGGAEKGAKGARKKRERESQEEDRERKKKNQEARKAIRKGADLRGISADVLRGRVPGAGRLGRTASKAAAALGLLYLAVELGPSAIGVAEGATGGLVKPFTAVPKKTLELIDRALPYLEAFFKAVDVTQDDIAGQIVSGRKPTPQSEADFFAKQFRLAQLEGTAEHAKRRLGKQLIGEFAGAFVKDELVDLVKTIFGLGSTQEEVRKIVRQELDRRLEQGGMKGGSPAGQAGRSFR